MTYEFQGMVGTSYSYKVTLKIYRYCDASAGGTAPLDPSMSLGIYLQDPGNPNNDKDWYTTEMLPLISSNFITPPSPGVDCSFNTTVCVEEGIFEGDIILAPNQGGYHLIVERCCRNGNIANLSNPGSLGQTYYCFIPPDPVVNSSPQFSDSPVPFICTGDTVTIVNNAVDPDGDDLVYSFELPYSGYSSSTIPVPDPQIDNNPYMMPIPGVLYNPGYSLGSPFGAGGFSSIDPQTGLTKYYIPNQGFFVVAIEIKEYRNGVLIAAVRRDLQLIAIACPVNAVPIISNVGGAGQTNYTIDEGQTICFPVSFMDPNGDSLYLTSSGLIFNSSIVNPPASLPNALGDGFVTSQFCWSTECGQAKPTPYQFVASVIDNGCPPKITNQIYSITVNPSPLPPAPAVSIVQDPPGPICIGTSVIFTAIPTFGGTNPIYQWQLNGVNVGANSNTYTNSNLINGDVITVSLTSNSVCVNSNNAISPPVVMVVNPNAAPSVAIVQNPPGSVCGGTAVTFTANPVNPGPTPVYQWMVNGIPSGTNNSVFTTSTLTMGSQVSVTLTADAACPAAVSNVINMVVNPVLTPSVLIVSSVSGAICPGQSVTFTAYPTNGGAPPAYQWQVNGINTGINSNTLTTTTLVNGDNVTVILTSNENCLTTPTANSNVINIVVTLPTNPSVSISSNPSGPVCQNDNIIFTAIPVSGGPAPVYQWQVNGVNTGIGGSSFAISSLNNGDDVSVVMTSSLTCLATNIANSNIITVVVNPLLSVSTSIVINPGTQFCEGTNVSFVATPVNGGTAPFYQWQVNGINTGTNSNVFSTTTLVNGDKVKVVITSNLNCVSPVSATSNQITVSVLPWVTPTVTIAPNPVGSICAGTSVTFTAAPVNGGPAPIYQWGVNGLPVGSGSSTFTSASLNDGDFIQVFMTSGVACPDPPVSTSNLIVMDVIPVVTPSVTVSVSQPWPVCEGTPFTFTANPVNGGPAPGYQWYINGILSGSTPDLTTSVLADGDSIKVRIISNAACANPISAMSDTLVAEILPYLVPDVTLSVNPNGAVCDGDSLFFQGNVQNEGSTPVYQWFLNGLTAGGNSAILSGVFNNNDTLQLVLTSSYQCVIEPVDTSNIIVTNVLPNLTPAVSITISPTGFVCPGDVLTFTATPVNGGGSPDYQWFTNSTPSGINAPVFTSSSLTNGDQIRVRLTSSESCLTTATALSNILPVQISPTIIPEINISVVPDTSICVGDTLSFSAVYTGGGSVPLFNWMVNGIATGITTASFTSDQLNNNDIIQVVIVSSAFCASPVSDTSNSIIAVLDPLLVPSAVITADPPGTFCDGMEITYSAIGINGGTNPGWQWLLNGNSTGSNTNTLVSDAFQDGDTLQLVYTSSEECLAFNPALSNQIIIDRLPPLVPVITAIDEVCFGEEITLSVSATGGNNGPYYLTVDNNLGQGSTFTFIPYQTALYTVMVTDSCSTPRSASKTIVVNPLPVPWFTIEPATPTILNPDVQFSDASLHAASWQWEFGDGATALEQFPMHLYSEPGYYNVLLIVTSDKGCIANAYRQIEIENVVTYYIPNAFSPNGDGVNDEFGVTGYSISGYELEVFNRWGEVVYASSGLTHPWNGRDVNGKDAPSGVYTYRVRVLNDPDKETRTGTITLVR